MRSPPAAWARIGQYALAVVAGAAAWVAHAADRLSGPLTPAVEDLVGALLFVDLLLGGAMLIVLPLRRRHPVAIACVTTAASAFSASSVGATAIAVGAMATRRRRAWAVSVAIVAVAAGTSAELVGPGFSPARIGVGLAFVVACLATGSFLGVRRDLLASLHERALTAEREQALVAVAAREAERTRIAREMHDVLAHRISLVALHAGALTYRGDLSHAETAGTAKTIQSNAQLALVELREVLGVLRTGSAGAVDSAVEPPQPTLAELPALLADARETGSVVQLDNDVAVRDLPETLSRTAFRIVQEALTNARRHAPGAPVTVRLARSRAAGAEPGGGDHMELEISNPAPAAPALMAAPPGVGLVGLTERAEMTGGTLTAGLRPDGAFVVRARLPWPV